MYPEVASGEPPRRRRRDRGLLRSRAVSRTEHTAAVVLRSIAYGEADRILTLLTESRGKVALIARGARKSAKRFAGALEPYAIIEGEIALGRGDVGRLAQARVLRAFPAVLAALERMSIAAAGLELVREAVPEREPDARLLPTVERFFEVVSEAPPRDEVRVAFALRVLALAGLSPNLASCGRCGRAAPEGKAALFDPGLGAIVCRACGGAPLKLSGALRARFDRAASRRWDEEASAQWPDDELRSGREALDALLARHLSHRLSGGDLVAQVREVRRAYRPRTEEA